jgi:uncharacterized membrane protein
MPAQPIFDDTDLDDRGHSNQRPGYHRRQIQFFLLKMLSQMSAACFFLIVAPTIRYYKNENYYPISEEGSDGKLTASNFRLSLLFVGVVQLFVTIASLIIGYFVVKKHNHTSFSRLHAMYSYLLYSPIYMTFIGVIFLSNQLMGVTIVQYHSRIWYFD